MEQLNNFILDQFSRELERLRLYEAVRATCHEMEVSVPNLYAIMELYCPSTGTLFTLVGSWELGLALHEMWEVSKRQWAIFPLRSTSRAPRIYNNRAPRIRLCMRISGSSYATFRFVYGIRGNVNGLNSWAYTYPPLR